MLNLTINGRAHTVGDDVDPQTPLLWVLRDTLGLVGTKYGCGVGQCSACTVHLNGAPIQSCQVPASAAVGQQITTIEGLAAPGAALTAVQQAWIEEDVAQCGYCQAGQIMRATALLARNPQPERRRDRSRHGREHLPLRHVHAHPQGDPQRRGEDGEDRRCAMSAYLPEFMQKLHAQRAAEAADVEPPRLHQAHGSRRRRARARGRRCRKARARRSRSRAAAQRSTRIRTCRSSPTARSCCSRRIPTSARA